MSWHLETHVLKPWHRSEALTTAEAAAIAGCPVRTMRRWCDEHGLGRKIGGTWAVSKVALAMYLDGNQTALDAYHVGDRSSPDVVAYFDRCGVVRPKTDKAANATYKPGGLRSIL